MNHKPIDVAQLLHQNKMQNQPKLYDIIDKAQVAFNDGWLIGVPHDTWTASTTGATV